MKKTYAEPEIKVKGFDTEDIITASGSNVGVKDWESGGIIGGGEAEEIG